MRDFKYAQSFQIGAPGEPDVSCRSDTLRPIAEAFTSNLIRTADLSAMPAHVAFFSKRDQLLVDCAESELGHKPNPDVYKWASEPLVPTRLYEKIDSLTSAFAAAHPDEDKNVRLAGSVGINFINSMLDTSRAMQRSLEAVFASIVLESWGAFEVLASDTWVAVVDNGPAEVASRIQLSSALLKGDEQIKPANVASLEYDPRKAYGSWLREVGRVSFQKLDFIRLFYAEAFGKEVNKLFDDTANGYIFALSAYRNALTHSAGKADKKFLKQVERFAELRNIQRDSLLLLDGELVKTLRSAAYQVGSALMKLADDALSPP